MIVISQNNGYPTPNKYESCSCNDSEWEDRYAYIVRDYNSCESTMWINNL